MTHTSHANINDVMAAAPFFAALYDQRYRIIWANEAARQFAAEAGRDIARGRCYEIWGLPSPCPGCPMAEVKKHKKGYSLTLPGRAHFEWPLENGHKQLSLIPVNDPGDGRLTFLETAIDITEMKENEKELAQTRSRLGDAQRLAKIGHWELLVKTETLFWSEEIFRIFEMDPESFGASYEAFLNATHPEDRDMVHQAYSESLKNRQPYCIEHRLLMDDGRIKYVQERCETEYDAHGNPVKSIGTVQDITENKLIEQENKSLQEKIIHSQKIDSVGRLAGGVAHDFNNMLFVILGNLDLVMAGMNKEDPISHALKEVRNAARRSADLTRQLLAFARQQPIVPRVLDLNKVIANMMKMLTRLIGENIELKWIPGLNLAKVRMDPTQIDQILVNLCVNARDAITKNGRITIETHMACVGEAECTQHPGFFPGEFVTLVVSDNGCGMDRKTQSCLFDPFFTTKKQDKGTGLGLSTIYGIVKQNNGFINIYSEPGKGTTFRIYLSIYKGKEAASPGKKNRVPVTGGHETILLVEDEVMILQFCARILRQLGYRVLKAATPEQALSIAGEEGDEIDLLLTDVIMSRMSGRDLAQVLTRDFPRLKTLYMSGYTANVIARHGILEDGIILLQKPFSTETLARKVREALNPVN